MKKEKATSSFGRKGSFGGFSMNSARGKQDVEPISGGKNKKGAS
jgi:hypothetical protein